MNNSPGSSGQHQARILNRGPKNVMPGQMNNSNSANMDDDGEIKGITFFQDIVLIPNQITTVDVPIPNMREIRVASTPLTPPPQPQLESILLNSLMGTPELNQIKNDGGDKMDTEIAEMVEKIPSELVYVKLDEGQITSPTDGGPNIIITLNESQLGSLACEAQKTSEGEFTAPEVPEESTGDTGTDNTSSEAHSPSLNEIIDLVDKEQQDVFNVMQDLLQKVDAIAIKQQKPARKKSASALIDRRHSKAEVALAQEDQPSQEPIAWKEEIGFLPGTELSFHVDKRGTLVLHCPFFPIKAKMDQAVRLLNLKRNENHKAGQVAVGLEETEPRIVENANSTQNSKVIISPKNGAKKTGDLSNGIASDSNGLSPPKCPKPIQTYPRKKESREKNAANPIAPVTSPVSKRMDRPTQPQINEAVKQKSNPRSEVVKSNPDHEQVKAKARQSEPNQKSSAASGYSGSTKDAGIKTPKPRQSEPTSFDKSTFGRITESLANRVKQEPTEKTVKTTLCVHCCTLGEVADFIEGRYCSDICRRTIKMLEVEKLKGQNPGTGAVAQTTKDKVKKKVNRKKAAEPSTSATALSESKMGPPSAPVIYAKKTTIAPIKLSESPTLVPQFLPTPRLDSSLQQFTETQTGHNYPVMHKIEAMDQDEVILRIEDQALGSEPMNVEEGAEDDEVESNPKSGPRPPPRKHRKRANLTMRKRPPAQSANPRRFSLEEKMRRPEPAETSKQVQVPPSTKNWQYFNWLNYLSETKSKAAPSRLFKQPVMPLENTFKVGMSLEAIDPVHQSLFCVVHIVEILGFRLRLRFTGYAEVYDFWVNADSSEIFPAGWCEDHGQELLGPPDYEYDRSQSFNWHHYLVTAPAQPASRESFAIVKEDVPLQNTSDVKIGMKLEAVDLKNINYICVATVGNVIGDRFLIHFDSWDNLFDYWTDLTSPFIHPVGWCEANGRDLVPPQWGDERDTGTPFVWDDYLKKTASVPMPASLFRPLPPVSFKKGMKLECVDKRTPSLIRVATVAEVDSHFITIHFDGWDSKYDYPVYELSPDIHPVGWCERTGHPLQPPPPPPKSSFWKKKKCPVYGCLGIGNIDGPRFPTHDSETHCPYAQLNYVTDFVLGDRLVSLYNPEPAVPETAPRRKSGSRRSSNASRTKSRAGSSKRSRKGSSARSENREKKLPQRVSQRGKRASVEQEAESEHSGALDISSPSPPKKSRKSMAQEEDSFISDLEAPVPVAEIRPTPKAEILPETLDEPKSSSTRKSSRSARSRRAAAGKSERKNSKSAEEPISGSTDSAPDEKPKAKPIVQAPPAAAIVKMEAYLTYPLFQSSTSTFVPAPAQMIPMPIVPGVPAASIDQPAPQNELPPNFNAHIQGIHNVVAGLNPTIVSTWGVDEVAAFVVKVGCSAGVSQKLIVEHKLDGESFLLLKQHDILSYGFPYGPAMKIANALDLINASN